VKRARQRRRWTQIGNVFCDEMTGWVHVCDETCRCGLWLFSALGSCMCSSSNIVNSVA
jgi:hypothetical protein